MKIFDFKCNDCNQTEERLVRNNTLPNCSKCGGETTKLVSVPAMVKTPFSGGRVVTK